MKPIKKLPSEVCSVVRSGVVIPTPAQAVVELVYNSIDAGASSIAVRVDLRLFKIQVVDNGNGISSSDLEAVGDRSVTSKCYTLDEYYNNLMYHGFRGEALASLREMCGLLEITTHPTDDNNTYRKLFIHGKEEKVKVSEMKRPTHGTTVMITDFMFNMPVRRERMKEAVELETIRSCMEYIALAHPEISITVRNDSKGRIILEKHKSSDLLSAFEHLFGHNLARTLAAVKYSTDKFKISGYISKEAYRHNDLQFIYVNRQPITKTKLHKLVVALLSKSSILRTNGPWKNKPIPKNVPVERWLSFPSLEKQKKFAVFIINIECARMEYEMCWDSKKPLIYFKNWNNILSCVSDSIQQFLRMEGLVDEDSQESDQRKTKNISGFSSLMGISHSSNESLSHDSLSKDNCPVDIDVETWDIQGAVHGIVAKRPRENLTSNQRNPCEDDVQNSGSSNVDANPFLTPDTYTNKEQSCVEITQNSVPPIVKFLKKYETPPAVRLKITKGAYRLKMIEEEKKKVAHKLGKFKFSGKPKLNSLKSCQNQERPTSVFLKCALEEKKTCTTQKNTKKTELKKQLLSRKTDEHVSNGPPNVCLLRRERSEVYCFNDESFDCSFGRDQLCGNNNSEEVVSSTMEYVNIPESRNALSLTSDDYKSKMSLRMTSTISNHRNEKNLSLAKKKQHIRSIISEEDTTGGYSSSILDVNDGGNIPSDGNIYKPCVVSVEPCEGMLYTGKSSDYSASNVYSGGGMSLYKHGDLNLQPHVLQFCHGEAGDKTSMNAHTKWSVNLGVSRMTTVSIPTPQCDIVSKATVASSFLKDKSLCSSTKESVKDRMNLRKYNKFMCSSIEPTSVSGRQPNNLHIAKSTSAGEKLLSYLNDSEDMELHSFEEKIVKPSFTLPEAISNAENNSRNTQLTCGSSEFHKATDFHFCSKNECNLDKDRVVDESGQQQENTEQMGSHNMPFIVRSSQNTKNCENIFEIFKKYTEHGGSIADNRSPYFTIQKNSDRCEKIKKPLEPKCVSNVTEVTVQKNNADDFEQPGRKQGESNAELSIFEISKTDQDVELFPCVLNNNNNNIQRETYRKPLVNFKFSECSPITLDSQTSIKELIDMQHELVCHEIPAVSVPTEVSNSPSKFSSHHILEYLKEDTDVPKRRRLSHNNINKEHVKQFSDEDEHCEPNGSVTVPTEHKSSTEKCEEIVSVIQKEKSYNEKTESSLDQSVTKDWLQLKNLEGKLFYFHAPSGFTSYDAPVGKNDSSFLMSKRFEFLPKGMSPLLAAASSVPSNYGPSSDSYRNSCEILNMATTFTDKEDLRTVKWRNKPDNLSEGISNILNINKPLTGNTLVPSNSTIPDLSFISAKMSGLLLQQKFDKRIFANIQVIGQLDNKFIVTLCSLDKHSSPHILGMFDQHAVHERIRLESLMKEYSDDKDDWSFTTTDLSEPIAMAISSKEFHVMGSFQTKFEKLGLYFILKDKNNIEIQNIPTCLYTRFLRERSTQWLETTLHILIQDVVQFLIKTSGQDSVVPEVFKDVINSEACKGAIKFGDPLSVVQCEDLLSSLSICDLPFYCAHGRPSFMPIFDLRQFEIERRKYVPEY